MRKSSLVALSLKLPFLAIKHAKNLCKESERPLKGHREVETYPRAKQLSGSRGLVKPCQDVSRMGAFFTIFDLIYSGVLSLSSQGQPM